MDGLPVDGQFEDFFDAVLPQATAVARRIVGDASVAEELAAEAFARAYARWPRLQRDPYRTAWVLRVTANLAIDVVRRRRPMPRVVTRQSPALDDEVATRLALAHALRALPARQRKVVVLRCLADLSESETAHLLGIAPGTVKAHLHRGLNHLRDQMNVNLLEVGHATDP